MHQMPEYVAYYRISPGGRRRDKNELQADVDADRDQTLGLEAQRQSVRSYLRGQAPIAEFTEIESGKRHTNRPRLLEALAKCRECGATLVIAKLDRLARNVAFIANLMESRIQFVAVDLPDANEFTIHIFAAVAQNERKTTSARVRAALSVLKKRGDSGEVIGHDENGNPLYKLGNPRLAEARERARLATRPKPVSASKEIRTLIMEWRNRGITISEIARNLNKRGIKSPRGHVWYPTSVKNQIWYETRKDVSDIEV